MEAGAGWTGLIMGAHRVQGMGSSPLVSWLLLCGVRRRRRSYWQQELQYMPRSRHVRLLLPTHWLGLQAVGSASGRIFWDPFQPGYFSYKLPSNTLSGQGSRNLIVRGAV